MDYCLFIIYFLYTLGNTFAIYPRIFNLHFFNTALQRATTPSPISRSRRRRRKRSCSSPYIQGCHRVRSTTLVCAWTVHKIHTYIHFHTFSIECNHIIMSCLLFIYYKYYIVIVIFIVYETILQCFRQKRFNAFVCVCLLLIALSHFGRILKNNIDNHFINNYVLIMMYIFLFQVSDTHAF